eukprot:g1643.t1
MSDRTLEERSIDLPSICAMKTRCQHGNKFIKMDVTSEITTKAREEISIERTRGPAQGVIEPEEQTKIDAGMMTTFTFDITNFDIPSVMTITGIDEEIDDGDIPVDITFSPRLTYTHRFPGMTAQQEIDGVEIDGHYYGQQERALSQMKVTSTNVDDDHAQMTVEQQYALVDVKSLNCTNCNYTVYANTICDDCNSYDPSGTTCVTHSSQLVASSQAECENLCTQNDHCGCVTFNASAGSCVTHANCSVHVGDGSNCTATADANVYVLGRPVGVPVTSTQVRTILPLDTDEFGVRQGWLQVKLESEPVSDVTITVTPPDAVSAGEMITVDPVCWNLPENWPNCRSFCDCCGTKDDGTQQEPCGWYCKCGIGIAEIEQKANDYLDCVSEVRTRCTQTELLFTPNDWRDWKRVLVQGLDDDVYDYDDVEVNGELVRMDAKFTIQIEATSVDALYNDLTQSLSGRNANDDSIGLTVGVICSTEGLGQDTTECIWKNI